MSVAAAIICLILTVKSALCCSSWPDSFRLWILRATPAGRDCKKASIIPSPRKWPAKGTGRSALCARSCRGWNEFLSGIAVEGAENLILLDSRLIGMRNFHLDLFKAVEKHVISRFIPVSARYSSTARRRNDRLGTNRIQTSQEDIGVRGIFNLRGQAAFILENQPIQILPADKFDALLGPIAILFGIALAQASVARLQTVLLEEFPAAQDVCFSFADLDRCLTSAPTPRQSGSRLIPV